MVRDEFIIENDIPDGVVFLEPFDTYSKGIIGVSTDGCHVVYSYEKLVDALMTDNKWNEIEAIEWLEYNTVRALDYIDRDFAPIIVNEVGI